MGEAMIKNSSDVQTLSSILLSTLDESVFFIELMKHLSNLIVADRTFVHIVKDDGSAKLIVENHNSIASGKELHRNEGVAGQVIRTKRAYFSNNALRDPLFAAETNKDLRAELCVPVAHEGVVMATIHFQSFTEKKEYSLADITAVMAVLAEIKKPLSNMKMFLSAKHLNELLLKKLENREKELAAMDEADIGITFRITEKDIVCQSQAMRNLIALANKLSLSDVNLIIKGEHGVGKELIARRIHCRSVRKDKAFMVIDPTTMSEQSLLDEIFGNENLKKKGALEVANGGTIVIDKVEVLSLAVQSRIMNYMKDGIAYRVGGLSPFKTNVRIIALTSKNLQENVVAKTFREDFFHTLNTMVVNVPALSERKEDIEILASYLLNYGKTPDLHKSFSPAAIKALSDYNWPGNVHELQKVVERAYILAEGKIVGKEHLADTILVSEQVQEEEKETLSFSEMTLEDLEKSHICRTLEYLAGNKTKTAKALGITVKTLYNKLHNYGIALEEKQA